MCVIKSLSLIFFKRSTQTTIETESKTTQSHSHTVPGLQSNKQSQTVTTTCKSSATQTNQDSIQSVGTQCSPAKKDSSTQVRAY